MRSRDMFEGLPDECSDLSLSERIEHYLNQYGYDNQDLARQTARDEMIDETHMMLVHLCRKQ